MNIQDWISFRILWFDLAVQGTFNNLQHHNPKASILWCSSFFLIQFSHPYMTSGKTIALTIQIFISKVMSVLFNMMSRFIVAFLSRNKHLLISWLQSLSTMISETKSFQSDTVSTFSLSICHVVIGPDVMSLVLWMLSFKQAFSLSSFTLIKKFFSSSLLSAIRMVSSAYLRLLIFLPAVWILACHSSRPAFHRIYSACKLNKQSDNKQSWHTPFPVLNQSILPCLVLTVASWATYRFHR